jgi:hypothetical protein
MGESTAFMAVLVMAAGSIHPSRKFLDWILVVDNFAEFSPHGGGDSTGRHFFGQISWLPTP